MLLSRVSQYAISGVLRLAALPPGGFCRVEDLVGGTCAPRHAVGKVFHTLARRGLLDSVRGAGGGFRLASNTLDMTLMDIIVAVEGPFESSVIMERGLCMPGLPCPMQQLLQPVADELQRVLRSTRIRDVINAIPAGVKKCCPETEGECGCAGASSSSVSSRGATP